MAGAVPQLTAEPELPVGLRLERVDLAVAEVADEEISAEAAEVCRREREPPRRVQQAVLSHAGDQVAGRVEGVDEAEALPGDLVFCILVLLRERDEDPRADRLDPERRVAGG